MRGIAALAVAAGHTRTLTLYDYDAGQVGILGKIFYFATGLGHQSVIIFFVLSGFLISMSIEKKRQKGNWSPMSYDSDRIVRLLTVLWPALLLTWGCDQLGLNLFPNSLAYMGGILTLPSLMPAEKTNFIFFLGNMFFLQGIAVPIFGSNTPLWSLSYEFWYYALYPLFFSILFSAKKFYYSILLAAISLFIFWMIGNEGQFYFLIWLMGVGAFFLSNYEYKILKYPIILGLAVVFWGITIIATRSSLLPAIFNDFSLGIITSVLIAILSKKIDNPVLFEKVSVSLSKISYSVYLVHMPLSVLISSWLTPERHIWNAEGLMIFITTFVLVLIGCYMMWYFFERKTFQIKHKLNFYFTNEQ